jgi:hypothetical protein
LPAVTDQTDAASERSPYAGVLALLPVLVLCAALACALAG